MLSVNLQQIGAKNFREFTAGGAAHRVHLPESILSRNVSLGKKQIVERRRVDCRDAAVVAHDANFCRNSRNFDAAIKLRQWRTSD